MSNNISLSEDEMVSYLKKTLLPTILVEGSDDCVAYRYLESKIKIENIDILKCGGRGMLLNVFKRREEFKSAKIVFIADKDMWFFTGIPEEFLGKIVFTEGYSLENDLYVKTLFEVLLDKNELIKFHYLIEELSTWFAYEVNRYKETGTVLCNFHINRICPEMSLCNTFKESIGFVDPPVDLKKWIAQEYVIALRGKNLFQALLRFLSHSKRQSKYSRENLIEIGAKVDNFRVEHLVKNVLDRLSECS